MVDTFSIQARGFYEKLGYEKFERLDYPPAHWPGFPRKDRRFRKGYWERRFQ